MTISNEQCSQSPQAPESLIAILLRLVLLDWGIGPVNAVDVELSGLPNEVLDQVALVLGQKHLLGFVYHVADIFYQALALC